MLQHAERVMSAVDPDANGSADFVCGHSWLADSDNRRSVDFVHGHPLVIDSHDPNRRTRSARVPLDEVQGTDDSSRRLRRSSFRRLKSPGTPDDRLPRSQARETKIRGARMLQHAERVTPAVDSDDANRPTRHARVPLDEVQGTDDSSRQLSGRRCGDFLGPHQHQSEQAAKQVASARSRERSRSRALKVA